VRYTREFVRRDVLIGPEHTEELRKFLGTIGPMKRRSWY